MNDDEEVRITLQNYGRCSPRMNPDIKPSKIAALFYSVSQIDIMEAKSKFCFNCHLQAACLEYAVRTREQHGVWGGLDENERRLLMRRRRTLRAS